MPEPSKSAFTPPFKVIVDGKVEHKGVSSEDQAILFAEGHRNRNFKSKIVVEDHEQRLVWFHDARAPQ